MQLQKSLSNCYLLLGNDQLLLQESHDIICKIAKKNHFDERVSIMLDANTDWFYIFNLCKSRSLFSSRHILFLLLPEGRIKKDIGDKLIHLFSLLHEDLLLIIRGNINSTLEKSAWFKALNSIAAILVSCITPEQEHFPQWLMKRAKSMNLKLDNAACKLLCYSYEGNLPALVQTLEILFLIYPDRNITFTRVEIIVNDTSHFTIFNLIEAVLAGKSKRVIHILQQLQIEDIDLRILLRSIQREIMLILMLKRQKIASYRKKIFEEYKIWYKRKLLLNKAVERLTILQLRNAIAIAVKIAIALKQDYYKEYIWYDFNTLILILCSKSMPEESDIFI